MDGSGSPRAGPVGQSSWGAHSRDVLGAQQCSSSSKSWCCGQDGRVSCHGKHREEVSVSCLDQTWLSLPALDEDKDPSEKPPQHRDPPPSLCPDPAEPRVFPLS